MLLIRNGRLIDPAQDRDDRLDLFADGGVIVQLAPRIDPGSLTGVSGGKRSELRIVDAAGAVVTPGFIDMHTHLREPGFESKETIVTGCNAAAAGGFTAVACMPNTNPVNDNPVVTTYINARAREQGCVRVYPIGAITRGAHGESLTDMGALKEAGIVAVSDDGEPVENAEIMRRALEYVKHFSLPVIAHCEEKSLAADGVMHEGAVSTRLGLPGIPSAAEDVMAARDVILAKMTGSRLHIAHVSTAGAVEIIRQAKARGVSVTGEATPHHFTLTDEAVGAFDANAKVNPPLRSSNDREAVRKGLKDGTIEVIATDHAPHTAGDKDTEYASAANGIAGLETAVSLTLHELVHAGIITLSQAIARLSTNPARILNVSGGTLTEGSVADITVLDMDRECTVNPAQWKSKSRNTPFAGRLLRGGPIMTIVGGTVVWEIR
ncbi:MAG: amidohydrolase family protein [Chitinivibrionales bacterium]|nr:amidohydrolase family protein [Chitinivibrionales bacterium]